MNKLGTIGNLFLINGLKWEQVGTNWKIVNRFSIHGFKLEKIGKVGNSWKHILNPWIKVSKNRKKLETCF